jgi:hypothetical protein
MGIVSVEEEMPKEIDRGEMACLPGKRQRLISVDLGLVPAMAFSIEASECGPAEPLGNTTDTLGTANTQEALERLGGLVIELDLLREFSPPADKLSKSLLEFETYIRNNVEFIPNFGERYRQGETISTALSNRRLS